MEDEGLAVAAQSGPALTPPPAARRGGEMLMIDQHDTEFEEITIAGVTDEDGKGWAIERSDGWSFFVPPTSPVVPRIGDTARFYGRGIGRPVRGLAINGTVVFYRTNAEYWQDFEAEQQRADQRRREKFEEQRADHDQRFLALPVAMQERITKFRASSDDWRWRNESYELFTCEQAVLIATTLKTTEAIVDFQSADWEVQKETVTGLSDGHSGNTFDCACYLAKLLLTDPEYVKLAHGALATLAGCQEYGCHVAPSPPGEPGAEVAGG